MELSCLPAETPTTAGSGSADPFYDSYCPPYAQRRRERHGERDGDGRAPAVTGLPAPCGPLPGPAPAAAEVPTLGGGRGPGARPDHSHCSWGGGLGRQGDAAQLWRRINGTRGGGGGGGGRGEGVQDTEEDERVRQSQSPGPSPSEENESALSVYDNLRSAVTPDNLLDVFAMEAGFQGCQELQALMEGRGASGENSSWSSCEIILPGSGADQDQDPDQEKDPEQEAELDSGPCPFDQRDPTLHIQLPLSHLQPHLAAGLPRSSQTAAAQHPEEPARRPRVPPPLPLADPLASALRSLLTSLQQQIVQQREMYEAQIISLEMRNEELQVEVVGLRANLAQQRRWYQVVQAKILESERARAAAELRNAALQREMEQLFDTFGELNNEAKKTECIVRSF